MAGSGRLLAARLIAAVSALMWGLFDFGVIDLVTALVRDPLFAEHWMLELGWGLLYLFLVAVPFGVLAFRPRTALLLCQLGIASCSLAVAALVSGQPGHLVPAAAVGASSAVLWVLVGARPPVVRWKAGVPSALALGGAVAWCSYAVTMARSTAYDEITNGLTHFPAQAALGFALALGGLLVVGTGPGTPGHRVEVVTVTGSALLLGIESVVNPDLVGSLGTTGGVAAAAWAVALLLVVLFGRPPLRRTGRRHDQQ